MYQSRFGFRCVCGSVCGHNGKISYFVPFCLRWGKGFFISRKMNFWCYSWILEGLFSYAFKFSGSCRGTGPCTSPARLAGALSLSCP